MTIAMPTESSNRVGRLLRRVEDALADDLVPAEIFADEDLFRLEVEHIFTRAWIFVGHESEIPNAGDFVLRRIGLDPVIVTRDGDGGVNVMSNYCRHRGTQICQSDRGNTRFFKCSYHGWTYSNTGELVGTPLMRPAYGEPLDPKAWGLLRAPRVESRHGFIFATLSEDAPTLDEYLGGAGWMLDLMVGLHPDGMRVIGPPDRYTLSVNWKTAAENAGGDIYHVPTLHGSAEEVAMSVALDGTVASARIFEFENGHTALGQTWTEVMGPEFNAWAYPPSVKDHLDLSGLDASQSYVVNHASPTVGTIFPNLSFVRLLSPTLPGEPFTVFTSYRQWQPVSPSKVELWSWQFVWNFQSEEDAVRDYLTGQFAFGSAGIFEQDDTVAWEGATRAGASPWARKAGMNFHFQQGRKSEIDQSPDPNWAGPGILRNTGYGEHVQMNFYRHWLDLMKAAAQEEGIDI